MKTFGALLFSLVLGCLSSGWAADLEAGVAVVDITPPTGYRLSGYFHERASTGTHDPLQAKAVVFRQGDASAALVFCDVIGMAPEVTSAARKRASAKTGIPASNILIAATHSHTGPLYHGTLRNHYHDLALQRDGKDAHESVDYGSELTGKLVAAINGAFANLQAVSLETTHIRQEGLSFNRRFHMKGGGPVRFNPGKLNPNILRVAGPIDPDVGFLLARGVMDKAPLFSLSVFALHLDTVGGTEYAADYPYYLEQTLRQSLGEDLVSLFGIGTCGDINHVDVSHKLPQKGHEEAKRIGSALGASITQTLDSLRVVEKPSLAVQQVAVPIPLKAYTAEEVARAKAVLIKAETTSVPFMDRVKASRTLLLALRNTDKLPMDVQVFRLSEQVAIVGLPGEVFAELGLAIKKASPFAKTIVIELANDAPAYIPTEKAIEEGSYETENCIIQSGGGELLVDAAVGLLNKLGLSG
jgi:neutral ceramidase